MSQQISSRKSEGPSPVLAVDVDGTLVQADLFVESIFQAASASPMRLLRWLRLIRHPETLKSEVASATDLDASNIPYRASVIELIRSYRDQGFAVVMATAAHEHHAQKVASHLGLFDHVLATTAQRNLKGKAKAAALIEMFGEGGFDYVGDSDADKHVWDVCRKKYFVGPLYRFCRLRKKISDLELVEGRPFWAIARSWLRLIRPHQWAKNMLIIVPVVGAHRFDMGALGLAIVAIAIASCFASGTYILNDLYDVRSDRSHPTKCRRPIASGEVSPLFAAISGLVLLGTAGAGAAMVSAPLAMMLGLYLVATTCYSLVIKRKPVVDLICLALLYVWRIYFGGIATGIEVSVWLSGFAFFAFLGMAATKRLVEVRRVATSCPDRDAVVRGYLSAEVGFLAGLSSGAYFASLGVFLIYVQSAEVKLAYVRPDWLLAACPVLCAIFLRLLLKANRGELDDDPVVYVLRDRACQVGVGAILAVAGLALVGPGVVG